MRDCEHCANYVAWDDRPEIKSCRKWECEYEPIDDIEMLKEKLKSIENDTIAAKINAAMDDADALTKWIDAEDGLMSRKAAYEVLTEYYHHKTEIQHIGLNEALLKVPTAADVAPVRHGRWVKMSDADGYYFCCSVCGEELYRKVIFNRGFELFPAKESIDKTNFCSNCGAKMEASDEET